MIKSVNNYPISQLFDIEAGVIYAIPRYQREKIDPMEFRPEFQQAFYEVENRRLDDYEKSRVLEQEFGIRGWRTRREMNPDIIYEIPMPKRS